MKVLYATDLHGHMDKFEAVLDIIEDHDLIILGADILPKGAGTTEDVIIDFIDNKLRKFFYNTDGIPVIIDFGNDDWYMFYNLFKNTVNQFDYVHISHMTNIRVGDYTFIGMHYVPDYPFGIKDWCRRDFKKVCDLEQLGMPYTSKAGKIDVIHSLDSYFLNQKTIREELDSLPKPNNKTIYIIHAPPAYSALDVCYRVGPVGSMDVRNWIEDEKPWLTLHGHIHESFKITKTCINKVYDTICINPGQNDDNGFVWTEFDLDDIEKTFVRKEMSL